MSTLSDKHLELEALKRELTEKEKERDNWEIEVSEKDYDNWLDDCYGDVEIAGMTSSTSYALKELDPTAYRCGKSDYEAGLDLEEDPDYRDLIAEIDDLETDIEALESEIKELEQEDTEE
jgi:hypothetical protein